MPEPALVCGIDEAGRGPWAGPVVAAAVVLDPKSIPEGLNDSKKLSERAREKLAPLIRERALAWAVAEASVEEIDRLNILQATLLAMQRAVAALQPAPSAALIDGNRCPQLCCPARAIVGGDALEPAISAASILAKVHRDRWCVQVDEQYPQYGFSGHKGYGTAVHMAALREHGACIHHRRSFAPVAKVLV